MPFPALEDPIADADAVASDLTTITAALDALPATPLEADLPDIVQIVTDLNGAAVAMQAIVAQILTTLSTTRINS